MQTDWETDSKSETAESGRGSESESVRVGDMVGFGVIPGVGKMPTSGVVRVYFPKWQLPRANGLNTAVLGRQRTKLTFLGGA